MSSSYFAHSHTEKNAQFLSGIKKFSLLNFSNSGLVVDGKAQLNEKRSMQHALITGGSGYGKTVSYVIPNLMKLRNASIYVLDPSQELSDLTSKHLSKYFEIKTINLGRVSQSEYWNPLDSVKTKDDIKMMADAIISSAYPNESADSKFWNDSAKSILEVCLSSVNGNAEQNNLFYVYTMLNRFNASDKEALNEQFSKTLDEELWQVYKGLLSQPEKVWGSQLATAKTALAPIASETLRELSNRSTIDFKEFRKKPSLLYIVVPEHRIKENALYLSLLFREIFETLMEMPEKKDLPQYILLDEAGNIYVDKLPQYVTVLRKRRTSISLIIQSFRQLESLYGNDANTIIENTLNHIYFPGLGLETCKQISEKVGYREIGSQSSYFPSNKKSEGREPLLSVERIRTLKNGRALLLSGNLPPVMLKLTPWFRNIWMKLKLKK